MVEIILQWPLDDRQSRGLLEFCVRCGVDCFAASFIYWDRAQGERIDAAFFDRLSPFSLGKRILERMVVPAGAESRIAMECWSLNGETIGMILNACEGSLSNYASGRVPEDWTFYRGDELFLGFVSHEQFAFLRLAEEEVRGFDDVGIGYSMR
jgi:hypothetical protein